jgi:hypothetical protein
VFISYGFYLPHITSEVTRNWRKWHCEEFHDLHSSPNIIRVIKSRIMRWAGRVAHTVDRKVRAGFWWGSLREIGHLGDLGVDGRIILKYI